MKRIGKKEKLIFSSGFISYGIRTSNGWEHCNPVNPNINDKIIKVKPDDLIDKNGSFWLPIGNVKFKKVAKHRRRHHNQTCPVCEEKKKNIRRHYQIYHPSFWEKHFIKPFEKAQFGELYGVRFIKTK